MNEITVPVAHFFEVTPLFLRMVARDLAAAGVRNLTLGHRSVVEIFQRPAARDEFRLAVENAGLRYTDAHAAFGPESDFNCPDESQRAFMIDRSKATLRLAADMGCSSCVFHVGNAPYPDATLAQYQDCAKRSLEALLPVAEALDVTICIENGWFATNTPEMLLELVETFASGHLGVCFDSGHAHLMARGKDSPDNDFVRRCWNGFGPVAWDENILEKLLPHVVTCHLHDNDGTDDRHSLPGRGTTDWPRLMSTLSRAPRLKTIQAETSLVEWELGMATHARCFQSLLRTGTPA